MNGRQNVRLTSSLANRKSSFFPPFRCLFGCCCTHFPVSAPTTAATLLFPTHQPDRKVVCCSIRSRVDGEESEDEQTGKTRKHSQSLIQRQTQTEGEREKDSSDSTDDHQAKAAPASPQHTTLLTHSLTPHTVSDRQGMQKDAGGVGGRSVSDKTARQKGK